MKLYTISELEQLTTEEINDILHSRCKLLTRMVKDAFLGKEVNSIGSKSEEINGKKEKFVCKIQEIQYHAKDKAWFGEDFIIAPINVYLDGYNSKSKTGSIYQDYSTGGAFTNLMEKHIDKGARIHWGIKKNQGQNFINLDLLFPANLIIPDIVAFTQYKNTIEEYQKKKIKSKQTKLVINENFKQELENKLITQIEEIKNNKFNLLKEDHSYVPEDKNYLMEFIDKASKSYSPFNDESLNAVVKKFPDNEEIILAIGFGHDEVFEYASERLKDSKEFLTYCIDNHKGNSLEYASERVRDDEAILLRAIKAVGGQIMRAASDRLKSDKRVALIAIKDQAMAYQHISEDLKLDEEVIETLIEQEPDFFNPVPVIKHNKALLIKAFKKAYPDSSSLLLEYTSEELRNDIDVAFAAIQCKEDNIKYIGEKLKAEIGDFEPFAYLKNITLYKDMNAELTNDSSNTKRKVKM